VKVEVFKEDVAESYCEYNIGSMQKGCEDTYDLAREGEGLYLLDAARALRPGEALIVIKKEEGK